MELLDRADLGYFEKKREDWDSTKTLPEDLIGVLCITMARERILFYPQAHMSRNYRTSLLAGLRT